MSAPARRLRIGLLTDGLEERMEDGRAVIANGGVGVYIAHLINALAAHAGCEVVLIRHGQARLDLFHDPRVRTVAVPWSSSARLSRALDRPYGRLARELDLDVLHYPNQFGGAFLSSSVHRVVTLHDVTPLLFPAFHPYLRVAAYRVLLRRALDRADHIIVDASHTKSDLVQRGLAAAENISVIPLGVGAEFTPLPRSRTPPDDGLPERFILTVGVLEPRKNHVGLLRALQMLHRQGEQISLVIVGREGWRWRDPLDTPELSPLRPWVRVLRNVTDAALVDLYRRATVFAYPSLYEGFGLPVLEAMACGTPVVASNRSSLPEVAGDAAMLVDPSDAAALAEGLRCVMHDAHLRQRLIQDGLQRARAFSWERTAEETVQVYRRVAPNAGPTAEK